MRFIKGFLIGFLPFLFLIFLVFFLLMGSSLLILFDDTTGGQVLDIKTRPQDRWSRDYSTVRPYIDLGYSDEEQAQVEASNLSNNLKNYYKLSKLYKEHLSVTKYKDDEMLHSFLLGVISTESGGRFYDSGIDIKDIFLHPTDKDSGAYTGCFGLSRDLFLGSGGYKDQLVQKYKPIERVDMESVLYIPYASYLSMDAFLGKTGQFERQVGELVGEIADRFGIGKRDEFTKFSKFNIGQSQYHGAEVVEWDAYLSFLAAVYKLSGEDFSRLQLIGGNEDFSESTARKLFIGLSGINKIPSSYKDLGYMSLPVKLKVGDRVLNQSLWSYVMGEYEGTGLLDGAYQKMLELSSSDSGGLQARVINFHYGLNSYLQGERIKSLVLSSVSDMTTEYLAGGVYGGKTITQLIADTTSLSSLKRGHIKRMEPWFGNTRNQGEVKGKGPVGQGIFTRVVSKWQVPFYSQQPKSTGVYESWGGVSYGTVGTFEQTGCHVYSFAYGVSAVTGRLINPPEMAAAMYLLGGLNDQGLLDTGSGGVKIKLLMESLGIRGYYQGQAGSFEGLFGEVDRALSDGALVILRGRNGSNRIAFGENHFFVLEEKRGSEYLMYSSSRLDQCTWQSKSFFGGNNLYSYQFYVIKK